MAGAKKNAKRKRAWIVFQDESGISQLPSIRRTWAPRGETPILIHPFNWKRMSISAAIAYRHDGQRARLFFQMRPGSYDSPTLIAFLEDLRREFRGDRVLLIWDGLPAHKSKDMKEYLYAQRHWLQAERLPSYSPDLNPVESLWGNVKGQELANRCVDELGEMTAAARNGLERVRRRSTLLFGFLRHTGLSL